VIPDGYDGEKKIKNLKLYFFYYYYYYYYFGASSMSLHKNLQGPQFGQLLGVILKTKFGPAGLAWLNQAMKGPFFNF